VLGGQAALSAYQTGRLANIGLNHHSIDGGGGYSAGPEAGYFFPFSTDKAYVQLKT
jgi:hypothetical protein